MRRWSRSVQEQATSFRDWARSCTLEPRPRVEPIKFDVPLEEFCENDLPPSLLVLLLKLNKEAPSCLDVFRVRYNNRNVRKLRDALENGRLINVDKYDSCTIASVLKLLLKGIPEGVFGLEGEMHLFGAVDLPSNQQIDSIHEFMISLPVYTQKLLVLLFGTFRAIASMTKVRGVGMTAEALGVAVAPDLFQACVFDKKNITKEDVWRCKVATRVIKCLIEQFSTCNIFGQQNYEYYTQMTGQILHVNDQWICAVKNPPPPENDQDLEAYARRLSFEADKTWLQCESNRLRNKRYRCGLSKSEDIEATFKNARDAYSSLRVYYNVAEQSISMPVESMISKFSMSSSNSSN